MVYVDLNGDTGESFGRWQMTGEEALLSEITSCSLACGFHAGDPAVMRRTVKRAAAAGVSIGAHPGYPDLQGFGRRNMALTPEEVYDMVLYQLGALEAFCRVERVPLRHVKAHGALYNTGAADLETARAVCRAAADFQADLLVYGLSGSCWIRAAEETGLKPVSEVFADRRYHADGTLVARSEKGAVIERVEDVVRQAEQMVFSGEVTAVDGSAASVKADTICIHGDGADAAAFAGKLRSALEQHGVSIQAPGGFS
ncbi:LamB/YcsF family protein [Alkalicoccus urumqiensis]|uniref:5-oxoprolinase subunit A n=1 Tax=Alkalicoccus urumqiensis TaxID=1548213 RepID=A0A2P6ML80_ALKUR|nr:5-oxoprolinase subunit PxpA [Alkalicoccus urumqiensis]PRO67024.1 LamB/YcsF family protein [Alkalicoccus urumqiensis]